jgi:uncharacterized protein YutE (UPF0331/DUF86 family)
MTPSVIREKIVSERIKWIREMVAGIKSLPMADFEQFSADPRNVASAESYLRRGLEALLDLGRHIMAKGFGKAVPEYKEIARELQGFGILSEATATKLRILAGYRNRMVHFYHEITREELHNICTDEVSDVEEVLNEMVAWINLHPGMIDKSL